MSAGPIPSQDIFHYYHNAEVAIWMSFRWQLGKEAGINKINRLLPILWLFISVPPTPVS
jgi:hypothetical protein